MELSLERLQRALVWLHPEVVEIAAFFEETGDIEIRIVSETFLKLRKETRERMLFQMMANRDNRLLSEFKIKAVCLTPFEYRLLVNKKPAN